ncbi:hypothetical protein QQ045_020577 [Rhodiola kirilowii]
MPRRIDFLSEGQSMKDENSSCSAATTSSSSPKPQSLQLIKFNKPVWNDEYINQLRVVLKRGGWQEDDVAQTIDVSASGMFEKDGVMLDHLQCSTLCW